MICIECLDSNTSTIILRWHACQRDFSGVVIFELAVTELEVFQRQLSEVADGSLECASLVSPSIGVGIPSSLTLNFKRTRIGSNIVVRSTFRTTKDCGAISSLIVVDFSAIYSASEIWRLAQKFPMAPHHPSLEIG